jgi:hypothetical protein
MRIIDLPKIPQDIHRRLEQRSSERGQEVAYTIIASTGRGLWLFLLLPTWITVFACVSSMANVYWGILMLYSTIAGLVAAVAWWKFEFTREHPFLSSMAALIVLPVLLVMGGK